VRLKTEYTPTLFVPNAGGVAAGFTTTESDREWKDLQGNPVSPIKFDTIKDAREFIDNYGDVQSFTIFGNTKYEYAYIAEKHPEQEILWSPEHIVVAYIDIEVGTEGGMPDVDLANNPVTAITVKFSNEPTYFVFGCGHYTVHKENILYTLCDDEPDLLMKFLSLWREKSPDIVSGWNIKTFDIPYLINRIVYLDAGSEDRARWLSPWGSISRKEEQMYGKPVTTYRLLGLSTLDYLQLYRKYAKNAAQESYKLDHIAHVELKERKLDYSEYDSLHTLYRDNYQKFIEYNIHDVELVERINAKGRLIDMAILLAYDNKTNYEDCFTQVRMWDCITYNWLMSKGIVVPPIKETKKDQAYEGAYVKSPLVGLFHSIMGLDATSLYPHIQMQYNMSPETLIEPDNYTQAMVDVLAQGVSVESMLSGKLDLSALEGCTVTPNGQFFSTRKVGFLPEILLTMFNDRVKYKTKQLEAEREREACTDPARKLELSSLISRYENLQLAKKVGLNSAYGALGSEYFRYFDVRIAEGVTLAGQLSIRWIGNCLNAYLNNLLKTVAVDYVIASDTDSVYLNLEPLVKKAMKDSSDREKVINFMDQVYKTKLKGVLESSCQDLADYTHAFAQKMNMKREALADVGIWTAKKRYVLNVCDSEGVRYKEPKMLIHGLEAIKSSTPSLVREKIKDALKIILGGTEPELIEFVAKFKAEFNSLPIGDIAFPRGCNGMDKYRNKTGVRSKRTRFDVTVGENVTVTGADDTEIYISGTPIHVKGALNFNHWLKHYKLTDDYELIQNGEKVKFVLLKSGNKFNDTVFSFIRRIPKEFELEAQVDYDAQFQKTFVEPLTIVLDVIGWHTETQFNLEDFFS